MMVMSMLFLPPDMVHDLPWIRHDGQTVVRASAACRYVRIACAFDRIANT
jgi:hypothetical protein